MLPNLNVPGVYVQEITTLPPSVAAVPTAIPAFLGYTEITTDSNGDSLIDRPVRISSQKDYEAIFGFGPELAVTEAELDANGNFIRSDLQVRFHLYNAIRLFYANGGGECYIVSTGGYSYTGGGDAEIVDTDFTGAGRALDAISRVDEPTLLLFPDMAAVADPADLAGELQKIKMRTSKLVWLNPLKGMEGYEPLAKGMSTALPLVDTFQSAHNLNSLMELENILADV